MKQRLTLVDLASVLADLTGESKKSSADFLREFFSLTASALEGGESVRIKGFGTFKLTEVDSRKSVNVATGAEMEIPGHRKVTFVPARELAEAVNEAFEMFDPVELSDSVTDEMLESAEEESIEVAPAPKPVLEEVIEEVKAESADESKADEPDEALDEVVEREDKGADLGEIKQTLEKVFDDEEVDDSPVDESGELSEEKAPRRRFGWGFIVGFLTALVVLLVLQMYFPFRLPPELEKRLETFTAPATPIAVSDPSDQDSVFVEVKDSVSVLGAEIVPTQPSDPVIYDTVTKTRYLTTISREYYGNYHFWPYIYEENKAILGHPDRIRPGTRVVVPQLSKYGVDPNNEADVAEAKRKGVEIYSRYR